MSVILRMTPAGVVTPFTDPSINAPGDITAGPDGNIWFTNSGSNSIGRITPAGVVSYFVGTGIAKPLAITTGPDGNLWFTNSGSPASIGRITPAGVVTTFPASGSSSRPGSTGSPLAPTATSGS